MLGTGLGTLPGKLVRAKSVQLEGIPGVPAAWAHQELRAGEIDGHGVWMLEDAPGEPELGGSPSTTEPAWVRGFPVWLAARAWYNLSLPFNRRTLR